MVEEHQLLVVDLREAIHWTGIVRTLLKLDSKRPLLVHFLEEDKNNALLSSSRLLKSDLVRLLTALYENVARVDPRACVTPLLESCGWDLKRILAEKRLWVIKEVQYAQKSVELWAQTFQAEYRDTRGLSFVRLSPLCQDKLESLGSEIHKQVQKACFKEPDSGCSTSYTSMENVCVGGTFDRLHAGHRTLLSATVAVCSKTIYLGITSEVLLVKKRNRDLLEPYEKRKECVLAFIRKMSPNLEVAVGILDDVSCAPMPKEFTIQVLPGELDDKPPLAVTGEKMDGIVVSRETVSGAAWINQEREASGYQPILIIAVNLVGAMDQGSNSKKLSSSDLRDVDARKANKKRKA